MQGDSPIQNKTIIILSQQDWGDMYISKHHYALALSQAGNLVYFVNGPHIDNLSKGEVIISETEHPNLFVINHRLSFSLLLKYKFNYLYSFLIRKHISNIVKAVQRKVDYIWSFDLSDTLPLRFFPNDIKKVFIPVDELSEESAGKAAIGAEAIFSVTHEILAKFRQYKVPKVFLNHGVAAHFINDEVQYHVNKPIHIALSGNFLRPDIDWHTLLQIVNENKELVFHFYGSVSAGNANLGNENAVEAERQINELRKNENIILHGQTQTQQLASELKKADCFLICYDINKDQSGGTNYHKVLEYLATGNVVIANNITTYSGSGLVEMPEERDNHTLPALFKKVVANITQYNTQEQRIKRIEYAKQHLYTEQIKKIAAYL